MYGIFVLLLSSWLALAASQLIERNNAMAASYRAMQTQQSLRQLADGVRQFRALTGRSPATLDELVGTPGLDYLRTSRNEAQGYAVSGPLSDGVWLYTRTALTAVNLRKTATVADFFTANTCGAGPAVTANSWCGNGQLGLWYRHESREDAATQLFTARSRLNRQLQKFADYFSANQAFPGKTNSGVALSAGSVTSLTSLSNATGSATSCSGPFVWSGIPLECDGLYDLWGGAVGYAYFSPTHMALVAVSPVLDAGATTVHVIADLDRTP